MSAPRDPHLPDADVPGDAALVAAVRAGEREAFSELVRRHQVLLYRQALATVRDPDAAADLVQDTFIRAYTRLGSCREPHRFRAWVYTILRNQVRDYLKNVRRRSVPWDEHTAPASSAENPQRDAEGAEFRSRLSDVLDTLPEAQREAFLLKYVEDLSYEEMAQMLGTGTSALKMRVLRAREAIAARLGRDGIAPEAGDVTRVAGPSSMVQLVDGRTAHPGRTR
jgi:RNA polymerase sigma-70 factor, ECF subfamily